jgi:hypothetical protein
VGWLMMMMMMTTTYPFKWSYNSTLNLGHDDRIHTLFV